MQVVKSISVSAPLARTFQEFTQQFDKWWPRGHHLVGGEEFVAMLEPKVGGRWYERHPDGTECDWGKVLIWEPPHRVVMTWEIDAQWQPNPDVVSEVEVTFAETPTGTRVELTHRKLEAYGEAAEMVRGIFESENAWSGLLTLMGAYAEANA